MGDKWSDWVRFGVTLLITGSGLIWVVHAESTPPLDLTLPETAPPPGTWIMAKGRVEFCMDWRGRLVCSPMPDGYYKHLRECPCVAPPRLHNSLRPVHTIKYY